MSNYAELRSAVLDFMQQTITLADPFPGQAVSDETKLAVIDARILRAANSARKRAEKLNDWVYNQVSAEVTVPAGESVLMTNLTDIDSEEVFTSFKNVREITHEGVPVHMNSTLLRLRQIFKRPRRCRINAEFHGQYLKIAPALDEDVDLIVYGQRWMNDYTIVAEENDAMVITGTLTPDATLTALFVSDEVGYDSGASSYPRVIIQAPALLLGWRIIYYPDVASYPASPTGYWDAYAGDYATPDLVPGWNGAGGATGDPTVTATAMQTGTVLSTITDWLLSQGFDYMQWATICELNHLLKVFLPRTEGALAPPEKERDLSLESLLRWDTEMRDAQFNIGSR